MPPSIKPIQPSSNPSPSNECTPVQHIKILRSLGCLRSVQSARGEEMLVGRVEGWHGGVVGGAEALDVRGVFDATVDCEAFRAVE